MATSHILVQLSDALAAQVSAAAPLVAAIRIGTNRHIAGIVWRADTVVTSDQALPAQESYSVAVSGGTLLPARAARRDPALNLACLTLDSHAATGAIQAASAAAVGALALALGATSDGSPTVRIAAIHRTAHGAGGEAAVLDLAGALLAEGGPVLDARGGLIGMASGGPNGEAMVIPYRAIARFLDPLAMVQAPRLERRPRRGWLGVVLQPITVPDRLRTIAGQTSGRMVVSVTPGGPAEHAGLRLGDVLLAIDGQSVSGPQGLRAFIGPDRIGSAVAVRLMREGALRNATLTIAPQPLD